MRFILRWKNRPAGVCVNPRQLRLGDLISRATRSSHYRDKELHFPPISSWEDVPRHLEGMPKTALADFLANPGDFYSWNHSPRPLGPLECPVGNIGRIAVLGTGFELSAGVDSFPYPTSDELEDFEPDSIAGPAASLRQLAEAALDGRLRLGSLRRAILAFTGLKHGCLKQSDRDLLWRAFRTPVFEQFRGFSQELLAWECEAHDGLHVEEENAIFETPRGGGEILLTSLDCTEYSILRIGTGMTARLLTATCGCGDSSPRLVGLRSYASRRRDAVSAS
ncbi:MAG TPA: hypothetical protein VM120_04465 [Bryobacteraceae bacterium]|nr:hypothetical protein [Bryobacteraceae bacterium]